MATMMMEQMERFTPSGVSWITIEERAAQLKRDLHSPCPERMTQRNPRALEPDFYNLFCLVARPQQA